MKQLLESFTRIEETPGTPVVYHVTFEKYVKKIQAKGLLPLQKSNWVKAGGGRYNKDGGVFAFADPIDAFRWAFNQEFKLKEPVSIIKFHRGDDWYADPSDDIMLKMGNGEALKSDGMVSPDNIIGVVHISDLKSPVELDLTQEEWFAKIKETLENL